MRSASLVSLMIVLAPTNADAVSLIPTGTIASPISVEVKGSLFTRVRGIYPKGGPLETEFALTRARIGVDLRWKNHVRIQIEPDFAGDEADPTDVFVDLVPFEELGFRLGRAKVPFGALELESRWRLPSISRGLLSDLITDQGIGGRSIGGRASLRLKQFAVRPGLDVGAYRDAFDSPTDVAVRLEMQPWLKGAELSLAGYARPLIAANNEYGYAGDLAFTYDKKRLYLVVEGIVLYAKWLTPQGAVNENAVFTGGRLLAAYTFKSDGVRFQPFLGAEIIDPNARTRSDLGGAVRGGMNLILAEVLRFALEVDHQRGQAFFPEPEPRTTITLFVGVFLE